MAIAVFLIPAAASAEVKTIKVKTNKKGSCELHVIGDGSEGAITYGGRVDSCSTRFGVRRAHSQSFLYEEHKKLQVDATPRQSGPVPYEQRTTYEDEAAAPYRARFDVRVVLRGRKSMRKPRKPERWRDTSRRCRVGTTHHSGDTLFCVVQITFGG